MPRKAPVGDAIVLVDGLGKLRGVEYANGVRQYFGIPYARLSKRWTLPSLATKWSNDFHDGSKLGYE